jgi:DnaK suppressor protein
MLANKKRQFRGHVVVPAGGLVNRKAERLDKAFVERQRQRLTKLRDELADATQGEEAEEKEVNSQSSGQAQESEDDAQRLTTLELDGNLVARNVQRLAQVDRALKKISEGTYGLSDASNQAIPKERLEATPEAIYTVAEQAARESTGLRASSQK